MSKTDFSKVDTDIPEDKGIQAPTSTALAPTADAQVVDENFFSNDGMEGFHDKSMVTMPWIHLVHGVGDLSEKFAAGTLVLNGETIITTPREITFVRNRNFVIQKLTQAEKKAMEIAGDKAAVFKDPDEARRAGFVASWERKSNPGMPLFENAADMDILVRGTPDEAELFPLSDDDGVPYMIARIRCKGNQFRLVTQKLITAVQFNASKKLPPRAFKWQLTTKRGKEGDNLVWRMQVQQTGLNTPAFSQFASQFL